TLNQPPFDDENQQCRRETESRVVFPIGKVLTEGKGSLEAMKGRNKTGDSGAVFAKFIREESTKMILLPLNDLWVNKNRRQHQSADGDPVGAHDGKSNGHEKTSEIERVPRPGVRSRSCQPGIFADH